jgi:glycosyltransferase involved in cell wall biosynthesis
MGLRGAPLESITLLCDYLQSGTKEKYDFYLPLVQSSGATVRTIKNGWDNVDRATLPSGLREVAGHLRPNLLADIANLYLEFCDLRPEVVHAWLDWSNVRAGLAALLAGVPRILLSGRNLSPRHFALNTDYFYPAYKVLIERGGDSVQLLNNSQAGANDYAEWLSIPKEKIRILRNGVQLAEDAGRLPEYVAAFRLRHSIPAGAPVVGGMFRFSPEKQPLLWLEAAGYVARMVPDVHFVLFGDGLLSTEMRDAARALGIDGRTHFAGVIAPPSHGLACCDLILLTSSGEGTPNVLLEAQLLGLPIVTTDAGGAPEAVLDGVTGAVVKLRDPGEISHAVKMVLCDEKFRAAARREGPRFVKEKFGVDRMVNETLALYLQRRSTRISSQLEQT